MALPFNHSRERARMAARQLQAERDNRPTQPRQVRRDGTALALMGLALIAFATLMLAATGDNRVMRALCAGSELAGSLLMFLSIAVTMSEELQ